MANKKKKSAKGAKAIAVAVAVLEAVVPASEVIHQYHLPEGPPPYLQQQAMPERFHIESTLSTSRVTEAWQIAAVTTSASTSLSMLKSL